MSGSLSPKRVPSPIAPDSGKNKGPIHAAETGIAVSGLPQAAWGLIDRPATLPTGADSIRNVILFPHMKIKR